MFSDTVSPTVKLNDNNTIPQLGFGVYQIPKSKTYNTVSTAINMGYEHIDTALSYGNEEEVGKAIDKSGKPIFVTTKYFNPNPKQHSYDNAKEHFKTSFDNLGLKKIDLFLIHWPITKNKLYLDAWRALIDLQKEEKVKSIGVSNFTQNQLTELIEKTGVIPAINQVEMHPYLQQVCLRDFHDRYGIVTEAWSPLGRGKVLDDKVLKDIASHYGKTPAQIVLRWHMQLGVVTIPKSETPHRVEENIHIFDFQLTEDEMKTIEGLDRAERNGPDPAEYVFPEDFLEKRKK